MYGQIIDAWTTFSFLEEAFVWLYFGQGFNTDVYENVFIPIEIARKRPRQDLCFLYSPCSLVGGSTSVCGAEQYTIWLSAWMNYSERSLGEVLRYRR